MSSLFNQASLVLVPSGYKAGKVYSEKPISGDGDLTFTRNSTATRVNSSGEIESVSANVPRLDYSQGSCPSLLLEPQRTNLALYSEQFDNAYWPKISQGTGSTPVVTSNTSNAPNGTMTADRLQCNLNGGTTSSDRSWIDLGFTGLPTTGDTTISIYVKSNTTQNFNVAFQLTGVTVPNTVLITIGQEWTRYVISRTRNSSISFFRIGLIGEISGISDNCDILIWGAQLEVGSYATSYIPTTNATVTRLADTFTRNNIYTNGLITSSGGTWYVELKNNVAYTRDVADGVYIGDSSTINTGNQLMIRKTAIPTNGRLSIVKYVGGAATSLFDTTTNNVKLAIKWNGTTADVFENGVKVVSATAFTTTNMEFIYGKGSDVPKFIQAMALYPTPLSDSDCIALTS